MSKQGALIGPEWQRRLRVLWQWKNNIHITGPGVAFKNSDQGLSVCINPKRPTPPIVSSPPPVILAKITGSTRDGDNYRWKYTMRLMKKVKTEGGYSGWEEINGEDVTGYNLVERENGDSGTVSGIPITDEVTGILAAPNGLIRPVYRIAVDGGDPEYWFDWQNIPVVECDE